MGRPKKNNYQNQQEIKAAAAVADGAVDDQIHAKRELMIPTSGPDNPENLIALAIREKIPVENLEKLLKMRADFRAEQAREAYFAALAAFQRTVPPVPKTKKVYNKDGKTVRYAYAPLDVIIDAVKNKLAEFGFSYRFETKSEPAGILTTCFLIHAEGHSEKTDMNVPINPEGYMSAPQKTASAITYGKRYTFLNATGILTADDDDDAITAGDRDEDQPPARQPAARPAQAPAQSAPAAGPKLDAATIKANVGNLDLVRRIVPLTPAKSAELDALARDTVQAAFKKILTDLMANYFEYRRQKNVYNDASAVKEILKELHAADFAALDFTNALIALEALEAHFVADQRAANEKMDQPDNLPTGGEK